MRRVGLSVCLLSALVLVGCGSPQPQSQNGGDPGKAQGSSVCDDGFKIKLDPNFVDPSSCWTVSEKVFQPLTVGGTVVYFGEKSDSSKNRLVALDAATGKEKWHTEIENVDRIPRDLTVRPFSNGGQASVAVGYSYQVQGTATTPGKSGYRVLALNSDDGETVIDQSLNDAGDATWGDDAVAVIGTDDVVSVLTASGGTFQKIATVPWNSSDTEGASGADPEPVPVKSVLHVTKDRVVLAAGYPIGTKLVVSNGTLVASADRIWTAIDLAGQKKWSLPADERYVSFFGGYALVEEMAGGALSWIDLETGLQVKTPSFAPGQIFSAAEPRYSDSTDRFTSVGYGALSPDAKHFAVSGKFVLNTETGVQTSIANKADRNRLAVEVLSDTTGYGSGFAYDLASDKATDSANLTGAIGVSGSTLVFSDRKEAGSLGGARLK